MKTIADALAMLDPTNDNHWTADGLARLDTLKMFTANPALTREAVEQAVPGFTRTSQISSFPIASSPADASGVAEEPAGVFPDVEVEPSKVVAGPANPTDEITALEKALEEATARTENQKAAINVMTAELAELIAKQDELIVSITKLKPKDDSLDAVQSYLAAQMAQLEARADRARWVQANRADLLAAAQGVQSPLDAAAMLQNLGG